MAKRTIAGCRGILTGASSGIGRALACELVRQGARLVVVARRAERLDDLAKSLKDSHGTIETLAGDINDPVVRQSTIDLALQKFGGLDVLVNNAGIGGMGHFRRASPERLRQVMEVNFFSAAELIRLAVPHLKSGVKPIVVNIDSILGHRAVPYCAEYCASKFALRGLSESLRAEWARLGIDLLVVCPGTTETEFFDVAIDAKPPPWQQSRGVTAEYVARKTVAAMRRGRHEIVISASGKLLVWMNRLFPRAVDLFMTRYG